MPDDVPVAQVLEIAGSGAPLLDRARAIVENLDHWLPLDAIWLTLCGPESQVYATVGRRGLERPALDYLEGPEVARELQRADHHPGRPPICVTELPGPTHQLPTWADCRIPAGFRDGLGVPLREPGGTSVGFLNLVFADREPPSPALREGIDQVAPLIAEGLSPARSLLGTARIVDGASSGAILLRAGGCCPLPGFLTHPLLTTDPRMVEVARDMLLAGQPYRSFLWPDQVSPGATTHVRVTVLSAHDVPAFFLGTLLISPVSACELTARELQVLGLVVEGRSNNEIARSLFVSCRTVATHVENILHKLAVPTRTLAAVRAEREGWYVPSRAIPT